ncbi:MAG: phosphoribosyl-ATP diphosphatase [Hyphomicrobiales bacterium]|nr:MAG: phosphoribosyl-ATP diphosphatase [Hyphomicrobiales bacterium]
MSFTLEQLNERVLDRARANPAESYTAKLLSEGIDKCAKKLGEEAVEAVIAAVSKDKKATISESADVIYHLLVLLKASGVSLDEVMASLERRTAQTGLEEKASRKN